MRSNTLKGESLFGQLFTSLLVATTLVSAIVFFGSEGAPSNQLLGLMHGVLGVLLFVVFVFYLAKHIRRSLSYRRGALIITGIFSLLIFGSMIATGGYLLFIGVNERTRWVVNAHIVLSLLVIFFVLVHYAFHLVGFSKDLKRKQMARFRVAFTSSALNWGLLSTLMVFILSFVIGSSYNRNFTQEAAVENYNYSYGEHPFRPSETETYHNAFIDEREIAQSNNCRDCHSEIWAQWNSSMHRHAASDATYVTNINLLEQSKGIEATRYCEGCHAPVALLTGQLSKGGQHGGASGTLANDEGVGCLSCHNISKVKHVKGVGSFEFGPPSNYLYFGEDSKIKNAIWKQLIKTDPGLHRKEMLTPVLKDPKVCATCHTQFMDKDMNDWGWVKMQDEYGAWLESQYSSQTDHEFSNSDIVRCQDCHMPLVSANDPSANELGQVRSHRFIGANTFHPKLIGDEKQYNLTKKFLKENKVQVSIQKPNREKPIQDQRSLNEHLRSYQETPFYFYLGEKARVNVVISNQGVGHNFPGGTLDINEAWVYFSVRDVTGRVVYQSGALNENKEVDPFAHFYRSRPVNSKGELVWKHDLFNRVGEAEKNVIPAGKSDFVAYEFNLPYWVQGPLTVSAIIKYRKLNRRYSQWALGPDAFELPIVDMARHTLLIPIRIQEESNQSISKQAARP